jgi:hypothetical protein
MKGCLLKYMWASNCITGKQWGQFQGTDAGKVANENFQLLNELVKRIAGTGPGDYSKAMYLLCLEGQPPIYKRAPRIIRGYLLGQVHSEDLALRWAVAVMFMKGDQRARYIQNLKGEAQERAQIYNGREPEMIGDLPKCLITAQLMLNKNITRQRIFHFFRANSATYKYEPLENEKWRTVELVNEHMGYLIQTDDSECYTTANFYRDGNKFRDQDYKHRSVQGPQGWISINEE